MDRACPACGHLVFSGPPGTLGACAVCGWVDDFEQLVHADFLGANGAVSLRQAQRRGASLTSLVHARDPRWRPLRPGEESSTSSATSPTCYLVAPAPEDFVPWWLAR
ncbi:MAG: CPCC family cysteine-rich protein [Myxococcota bacterium]